jgi:hypothetical protein
MRARSQYTFYTPIGDASSVSCFLNFLLFPYSLNPLKSFSALSPLLSFFVSFINAVKYNRPVLILKPPVQRSQNQHSIYSYILSNRLTPDEVVAYPTSARAIPGIPILSSYASKAKFYGFMLPVPASGIIKHTSTKPLHLPIIFSSTD